ncbi:MAG: hypothetical protein K0Q49_1104 [Haloplasmataceae bacterium]|nr:hypothetical protein [Haloplasmataceae bacterium]
MKLEYLNKKNKEKNKDDKTKKEQEITLEDKESVVDNELNLEDEEDFRKAYPMNIRCKDGHYVRSLAEKMIDDYLFDHEILHVYEKKVTDISDEGTEEKFYCDFFLPKVAGGIYIEHFGLEEEKYLAKKERKIKFYTRNKFTLIITEQRHTENLEDYLDANIKKKIKEYEKK